MIYAPVIIPTLNRFEHLKMCLESLNKNHNSDKTEVFISVDFPPSDKYQEGHKLICDYLENNSFNFKKLHVFKQERNLGVCKGGENGYDNISFLTDIVSERFDRWILSEDDNVFSPCFLDYINEGLDRYKDDNTVFSICGYRFPYNLIIDNNNFLRQQSDFNAWGYGIWKNRYDSIKKLKVDYLRKILYNPLKVLKLWRVSNLQIVHLAGLSRKNGFKKADNFFTIYMIDKGMTQIMPAKSLVRNVGWDETGLHCLGFPNDVVNRFKNQEIDDSPSFDGLKGTGWEFFKENQKVIRDEDFQKFSFVDALNVYIRRIICFWK